MIAYLILVHRYPDQFKRMFKAIFDPGNVYLIHVDKNSAGHIAEEVRIFLKNYPNASMLESEKAQWGGYSLVNIELRGMTQLLKTNRSWSHFINLSGQDFPLKTQGYIQKFLADNPGKEFIQAHDQALIRPDTMQRVHGIHFESNEGMSQSDDSRSFMDGVVPYIGTQWMIVSRRFCEFVALAQESGRYKDFYKNSFIADEGFFQTVMMNNDCHGEVVQDDLRQIDWVPDGVIKLRPRTFTQSDAQMLLTSHRLFARKFDATVDEAILDEIELYLGLNDQRALVCSSLKPGRAAPHAFKTPQEDFAV